MELIARPPVDVEFLTLGGPYPGLTVDEALPKGFDWRKYQSLRLILHPGQWGPSTDLAPVINESAQHPDNTYWFQGVGWLNPADVAAKDGKTFLAVCTPDPTKKATITPSR